MAVNASAVMASGSCAALGEHRAGAGFPSFKRGFSLGFKTRGFLRVAIALGEKDVHVPAPWAAWPDQFAMAFVAKRATQGGLVAAPLEPRVAVAIPFGAVGLQPRHRVGHDLVVTKEDQRAAKAAAFEPFDFRFAPGEVARRPNDRDAVRLGDGAALFVGIEAEPDALGHSSTVKAASFASLTCIISEVAPMSFEVVGRFVD